MLVSGVLSQIFALVSQYAGILSGYAASWILPVGIGALIVFAVKSALQSSGGQPPNLGGMVMVAAYLGLLTLVFTYWVSPAPGLGQSIGGFVPNECLRIGQFIGLQNYQQSITEMQTWAGTLEKPSIFSLAYIWWLWMQAGVAAYAVLTVFIMLGPIIIVGILECVGPVTLPFFLVPGMSWLPSGWIKCYVAYSLCIPLAWALIAIISGFIMPNFSTATQGSMLLAIPRFLISIVLLGIAVILLLFIPKIASHLTSGASGAGTEWISMVGGRIS